MTLIGGRVVVDPDTGDETFFDDDGLVTDADTAARALYFGLTADAATTRVPQTTVTPPEIEVDDDGNITSQTDATVTTTMVAAGEPSDEAKVEHAKLATTLAQALIPYLKSNAVVTIIITTSTGGLQNSTNVGDPTDPPDTDQTLLGTLT